MKHVSTTSPAFTILPLIRSLFLAICLLSGTTAIAADLWETLEQDGEMLELMALESVGDSILLVAAKYEQQQLQITDESNSPPITAPVIRKQLHLISVDANLKINWRRSFPALPDVNEVFAVRATANRQMCIAFGRHYHADEFINPVVLQVDESGKIIWANIQGIPPSTIKQDRDSQVQMANLDSIRLADSSKNTCALGYILRRLSATEESLTVNLILFDDRGHLQWAFTRDTELYGKMFLSRDQHSDRYNLIQTNQSRDAAIEAMMAARPFKPFTSMLLVSSEGKLDNILENPESLSNIWVKHVVDYPGDGMLLAGNAKSAWVGVIDLNGKIIRSNNALAGEFSHVNYQNQNEYVLVRDESVVTVDSKLNLRQDREISGLVKNKYTNKSLESKLPEQVPVQNIVPLKNNSFLILYKFGSKILELEK